MRHFFFFVSAGPETMVMCATLQNCGDESTEMVTREACCMHNIDPSGIAYSYEGKCTMCPVGKFIIIIVVTIKNG